MTSAFSAPGSWVWVTSNWDVHHRAVAASPTLAKALRKSTASFGFAEEFCKITVGKPAPSTSKAKLHGKSANRARQCTWRVALSDNTAASTAYPVI